jgi:hypothetical protein
MNDKDFLIKHITKEKLLELEGKIPAIARQTTMVNYSDYLLRKSEQEILSFYSGLINDNSQWTITKICGSVMILTSHIHDLLITLVETKEEDETVKAHAGDLSFHSLIILATARYNIPEEYFIVMMELKQFRNMMAHDFKSIMETGFHQAIGPIAEAHMLIIFLVQAIRR